jgi:hypothetical protein
MQSSAAFRACASAGSRPAGPSALSNRADRSRRSSWARQDADALASIIIDVDGRAMAIDLSAKFTRAGEDLWRVDDEGKFGAGGITIPFLIRRGAVVHDSDAMERRRGCVAVSVRLR